MNATLTPRQVEVVQYVAMGKLDKEIGAELHISTKTVKRHLGDIYAKLGFGGMGSRYRLIAWQFNHKEAA